jgi:hypothetical protein
MGLGRRGEDATCGHIPVGVYDFAHFSVDEVVEGVNVLSNEASNLWRVTRHIKQHLARWRTLRKAGSSRHFSSTELENWGGRGGGEEEEML